MMGRGGDGGVELRHSEIMYLRTFSYRGNREMRGYLGVDRYGRMMDTDDEQ